MLINSRPYQCPLIAIAIYLLLCQLTSTRKLFSSKNSDLINYDRKCDLFARNQAIGDFSSFEEADKSLLLVLSVDPPSKNMESVPGFIKEAFQVAGTPSSEFLMTNCNS